MSFSLSKMISPTFILQKPINDEINLYPLFPKIQERHAFGCYDFMTRGTVDP